MAFISPRPLPSTSSALRVPLVPSLRLRMEYKVDFKVKTEPLMKTATVVVAIISIAGALTSASYTDRTTILAGIAAISGLAASLRL